MDADPEKSKTFADRIRVLFVAEVVTLAHAGRPVVLARQLDAARFDIQLAWDPRYSTLFPNLPWPVHAIPSISSARFLEALANGKPVFDAATLRGYVEADLALLDAVRPDVVIGDFRLSLAISARRARVPYLTITNAYWSPIVEQSFPVPDIPLTRWLPLGVAQLGFDRVREFVFRQHAAPLNRICREFGVPAPGSDLRRVYTDADATLYADFAELYPSARIGPGHHFLGPVLWEPDLALPHWWHELDERPAIFVTVGSSGDASLLPHIVGELATLNAQIIVATAGRLRLMDLPADVHVADFIPAQIACRRARLVVCNGGSPMTQQALSAGVPVLGICSNMDQLLNMNAVAAAGVGIRLRAARLRPGEVSASARQLLGDRTWASRAAAYASYGASYRSGTLCAEAIEKVPGLFSGRK